MTSISKSKSKPVDIFISKELDTLSKSLRKHKNKSNKKQAMHKTRALNEYVSTLLDNIDKTATVGEKRTKNVKSSLLRELENTIADDAMRRKQGEKPVIVLRGKRPDVLGAYHMPNEMRRKIRVGKKTKRKPNTNTKRETRKK
tara:strand:+ start:77 stop:505 length:429 start_codon:yes stop_codon:yes gene_type:complete